jgi:hypothetical protein
MASGVALAMWYAYSRPAQFPMILLVVGLLQFGAEGAGGLNLSAIWLLALLICTVLALCRMPGPRVRLSAIEISYMAFLGWALFEAYRSPDLFFAARAFMKWLYPLLAMLLARRAVLSGCLPELRLVFKWAVIASCVAFSLVGGFTQRFLPAVTLTPTTKSRVCLGPFTSSRWTASGRISSWRRL